MNIKLINYGYKNKPKRYHYNDAGADVYSMEKQVLRAHETIALKLGFGLELPDGYMAVIYPRSGHAKKGIISQMPPIDSGYKGEIHAIVTNTTNVDYIIEENERVGQIVIYSIVLPTFNIDELEERGKGAFNSTGK